MKNHRNHKLIFMQAFMCMCIALVVVGIRNGEMWLATSGAFGLGWSFDYVLRSALLMFRYRSWPWHGDGQA